MEDSPQHIGTKGVNYSSYLPKAQSLCQVQRQIRINRILDKARTRDDNSNLINEINSVKLSMTLFFSTILL